MAYPIDIISSWIEGDEIVEIIIEHKPGVDETKERRSPKPIEPDPEPLPPGNAEIMEKLDEVLSKLSSVQETTTTMAADVVSVKEASVSLSTGTVEKVA